MTLMMRPSMPGPTGTEIGAPVSAPPGRAPGPRSIHGDDAHGVLAEMLGHFEHQPVAAVLGLQRVQDRRQMIFELHVDDGADDLAHLAARRSPCRRHWAVAVCLSAAFLARGAAPLQLCRCCRLPGLAALGVAAFAIVFALLVSSSCVRSTACGSGTALERLGARNDFDQFLGDLRLALTVVGDRQLVDHVAGVARRIVHGAHLGAHFAGGILEQRPEDLHGDVARDEIGEDLARLRLVFVDGVAGRLRPPPRAEACRPG